jgi:hypothetical protein
MARLAAATLGVIPGGSISAESMPESPVSCGVRRKLYAFRPKEPYAPKLPRSGGAMSDGWFQQWFQQWFYRGFELFNPWRRITDSPALVQTKHLRTVSGIT